MRKHPAIYPALAALTVLLATPGPAQEAGVDDGAVIAETPVAVADPAPAPLLTIERTADGGISLDGIAPTAEAEADLLDRAREVAGDALVESRLRIGEGEIMTGWERATASALDALDALVSGVVMLDADRLELNGTAEHPEAREAALAILSDRWKASVDVQLEIADPYQFSAEKTDEGVSYSGHAPDEATLGRIEAAINDIAGIAAKGSLTLARGMPSESWPDLVADGFAALMAAETGRLEIEGEEVNITAEVADTGSRRRLMERLGTGWQVDLTLDDGRPDPELTLDIAEDGTLSAEGRLPEKVGSDPLSDMLGPIDTSGGLSADAYGSAEAWTDALDALAIAVPRMARGQIYMTDAIARFEGTLKPGFSAAELRGALRSTLGPRWEIGIELAEAPPPTRLEIVRTPEGADIDGILPSGVTAERLLAVLGDTDTSGLSSGGDGDSLAWARRLRFLARALHVFEEGSAEVEGRTVALSGKLAPGQTADDVSGWLGEQFGDGWQIDMDASEAPAEEGTRRIDIETGNEEVLQGGRWVAVHEFPVSETQCMAKMGEAQAGRRLTFVAGSSEIGGGQERLLDRLAGVARHCLEAGTLTLEVRGHTDDQGEAEENLALSEERAKEVVTELSERGVPADRLEAVGLGESEPIADNATEEGRARNRRIDFNWRN